MVKQKGLSEQIERLKIRRAKQAEIVESLASQLAELKVSTHKLAQESLKCDAIREVDLRHEQDRIVKKLDAGRRELETEQFKLTSYDDRIKQAEGKIETYRATYIDAMTKRAIELRGQAGALREDAEKKRKSAVKERDRFYKLAEQAGKHKLDLNGSRPLTDEEAVRLSTALALEADRKYDQLTDEADELDERADSVIKQIEDATEKARVKYERHAGFEAVQEADRILSNGGN